MTDEIIVYRLEILHEACSYVSEEGKWWQTIGYFKSKEDCKENGESYLKQSDIIKIEITEIHVR
jgi:hypothetical protein